MIVALRCGPAVADAGPQPIGRGRPGGSTPCPHLDIRRAFASLPPTMQCGHTKAQGFCGFGGGLYLTLTMAADAARYLANALKPQPDAAP